MNPSRIFIERPVATSSTSAQAMTPSASIRSFSDPPGMNAMTM